MISSARDVNDHPLAEGHPWDWQAFSDVFVNFTYKDSTYLTQKPKGLILLATWIYDSLMRMEKYDMIPKWYIVI